MLASKKRNENAILHMLNALCHNNANNAADLLKMIVSDDDATNEKVISDGMDTSITNLIAFHANQLTT